MCRHIEVAQKALEQFPEFAKTSKEILCEYRDIIDRSILSNDASMKAAYDAYNSIMVSLQKELDKDCLTFEEKKYILEKMEEIADKIEKKDTENKKWIAVTGKSKPGAESKSDRIQVNVRDILRVRR